MPSDVNPFEPWRPRPTDDQGRRSSEEEPLPRRHVDPEEDEEREPPWRHSHVPDLAWTPQEPPSRGWGVLFVWLTAGLIVLALVVWAANGGSHVTRVAASAGAVWVGMLLAMLIGVEWRWYSRLGWLVGGLAGMVLCWLFVPTTEGNNLWQAERMLARTRNLPAGELEVFTADAPRRREIVQDFDHLREPMREAERDWARRTVAAEIERARRESDPVAAADRLRAVKVAIATAGESSFEFVNDLTEAQREAIVSRLKALERELNGMTEKGQYREAAARARAATADVEAARELGMERELTERIRSWRRSNVLAWAKATEVVLKKLESEGKYVEVAGQGARYEAELEPEVAALAVPRKPHDDHLHPDFEVGQALERLFDCRRRALSGRLRLACTDLDALFQKGEDEQVAVRARKYEDEFRDENKAIALGEPPNLSAAFLPTREKALNRRAERAAKSLQELLTKKDYATVALRGMEAMRQLDSEGSAIGKTDWREPILSARRTALDARLEQARELTQQHLQKRQYQAIGEAGEKTYTNLAAEAEAVDRLGELTKFRATCRVIAKLAKAGNAEGEK